MLSVSTDTFDAKVHAQNTHTPEHKLQLRIGAHPYTCVCTTHFLERQRHIEVHIVA